MLQLDPPGQWHPKVHAKYLLSTQKWTGKKQKRSKTAKSSQKGDFARQNSPLRKCFLRLFSCPSSRPVRASRFAPPNFDRGLKTRISSDDRRSIKNDHLQCEKLKNRPFCALKCGPLKKNRKFFFRPSSRPVRASRFAPPNFDRGLKTRICGDDRRAIKKWSFSDQKWVTSPL